MSMRSNIPPKRHNFCQRSHQAAKTQRKGTAGRRACEILRRKRFPITDISIKRGLQNVNLQGRLERVSQSPPVILDSAHNPEAANSLAASIKELFPEKKIILIAGIMNDKDIRGILNPLVQIAESVILTKPKYARAASPEKLKGIIKDTGITNSPAAINSTGTVAEALELAKTRCREDNIILVTGSFYTTGEVKEILDGAGVLSGLRE